MNRIETERLIIRPTQSRDLYQIHEILSDPLTMTYFVEGTYEIEKVKEIIKRNETDVKHFTVMLKGSYRIIGKISFSDWFMKDTKEIGWIFNKLTWGQGYATEAAKGVLAFAFNNTTCHRIIATCQPENIASNKVCQNLGMRREADFKKSIYVKDDIWWDEYHYGILREEFFNQE